MVWEDIEFDANKVPNIKLGLHIGQIVFGLVAWIMEIIVFRAEGSTINGNVGWTFAVCFLSVPAWIYLAGAPRFPRTRHLAEPHVMLVVDSLYTILWLSAFATQAAYNTANLCGTACAVSKGIVAMGFFVCLLFGITTFLSMYSLKYYQFNGRLPGYDRIQSKNQNIDPDKAAFSMAPHGGDDAYAPISGRDNEHDPMDPRDDHSGYGGGGASSTSYTGAAGQSSAYGGAAGSSYSDHDGGRQGSPYAQGGLGPDNNSPYGAPARQPSPYGGSGIGQDDPYGLGNRTTAQANPFEQGSHDNNPFDDHVGYTPPVGGRPTPSPGPGAVMAPAGMYRPPTATEDYDDGRPAQFPAGNYDRSLR